MYYFITWKCLFFESTNGVAIPSVQILANCTNATFESELLSVLKSVRSSNFLLYFKEALKQSLPWSLLLEYCVYEEQQIVQCQWSHIRNVCERWQRFRKKFINSSSALIQCVLRASMVHCLSILNRVTRGIRNMLLGKTQ